LAHPWRSRAASQITRKKWTRTRIPKIRKSGNDHARSPIGHLLV
jgi:hypothetical protein